MSSAPAIQAAITARMKGRRPSFAIAMPVIGETMAPTRYVTKMVPSKVEEKL